MDNLPNNQPSQPQVIIPQKTFFESLWGKLAIFLASLTFLALILATLNYFNVVPLSQFPFLNSLPTKQIQTIKQANTIAQSSSTPSSDVVFKYETKKAQDLLAGYVKENLKSDVLLLEPQITQGLNSSGTKESVPNEFGFYLTTETLTISANMHYSPNSNDLSDQEIYIQPKKSLFTSTDELTPNTAKNIIGTYFTTTPTQLKCREVSPNYSYCEDFKQEKDSKKGVGLLTSAKNDLVIFTCFITPKNQNYQKITSCISPPN